MELEHIMYRALFHIEEITKELYDFSKPGVLVIPGFLTPDFCREAIADFRAKEHLFWEAPRVENTTKQELKVHYCGEADKGEREGGQFPYVCALKEAFSPLYKALGARAGFAQGAQLNSRGIHWYGAGSFGMGVHRDYSIDINLICSFTLSSNTRFYVHANKQGLGTQAFEVTPGSVILMRGPRRLEEHDYRPYHSVDRVTEDRFALLFRQKKLASPLSRPSERPA